MPRLTRVVTAAAAASSAQPEDVREREIEQALVDHVADFLLELGAEYALPGC